MANQTLQKMFTSPEFDTALANQPRNSAPNLLIDGNYTKDSTWWAGALGTGVQLSTTRAFTGSQSLKITGSHSHSPNVATAGKAGDDPTYGVIESEVGRIYRFSCRIWREAGNSTAGYVRAMIGAVGASGTDFDGGFGPEDAVNQVDIPTGQWFEYVNWYTVPASGTNAPYVGVYPKLSTFSVGASDVFYLDHVRFEDMTNAPPELVAPPPTGDRTTDTHNVQRLVNLAQNFRGTVVLREGTYAADIVTARSGRQPRIVGQGKQLTGVDGTIKMQGDHSTSDGDFSGGWLQGFSWVGSHTGASALELNGVSGVGGRDLCVAGTFTDGLLFHNVAAGDYTENCSFVMDFSDNIVGHAVHYKVTAGQASFHGSGLELGSNIQCNLTNSAIHIDTSARPYNAPMSAHVWTSTDAVPVFQHNGNVESNFNGTITVEAIGSGVAPQGTGMWLANGSPVYFGGSLSTYLGSGALDYGTFRLVNNVAAQGGALTPGVSAGPSSASRILDGNGRTLIDFGSHASAINYIEVDNGATGVYPTIYGWGSDAVVGLFLATKGGGGVYVNGVPVVTTTGAQTLAGKTLTAPVIATITNTGTLTLPTSTDTLVGRDTVDTLTNKRVSAKTVSFASSSSTNLNTDTYNRMTVTALAANFTFTISGTPVDGDLLEVRIKDNGTSRTISWPSQTQDSDTLTRVTATTINKTHQHLFEWDSAKSKFVLVRLLSY